MFVMKVIFATVCLVAWFNSVSVNAQDIENSRAKIISTKNVLFAFKETNDETPTVRQLSGVEKKSIPSKR